MRSRGAQQRGWKISARSAAKERTFFICRYASQLLHSAARAEALQPDGLFANHWPVNHQSRIIRRLALGLYWFLVPDLGRPARVSATFVRQCVRLEADRR